MTEIGSWLQDIQLGEHEELFVKNDIDIEIVKDLTEGDLAALGLSLGHRKRILRAILAMEAAKEVGKSGTIATGSSPQAHDPADAVATAAASSISAPAQASAERRQLTVMFCDLVGSTALSTQLDPEDLGRVIADFRAACANAVARFGGSVAKYMGDGALVYFGYPEAYEDAAARAILAGLALVEAVGALRRSTPTSRSFASASPPGRWWSAS